MNGSEGMQGRNERTGMEGEEQTDASQVCGVARNGAEWNGTPEWMNRRE